MAREGVAIAIVRADVAGRLARAAGEAKFPRAGLSLDGTLETWLREDPALAVEDRLRASLAASRAEDAVAGGAGVGPHRSDLKVRHLDKDMAADQCSTGEQKALLIALANARLVALERGAPPLLLLDEVAAHLDETRRKALFEAILSLGAQAWMTGTDVQFFAPLSGAAQFFRIADGATAPLPGAA
jgi:DNA replication and repair protein RecF